MKIKVNDATPVQLNWMVAKAEGIGLGPRGFVVYYHEGEPAPWQPTTDWAQGGPIIEREGITLLHMGDDWRDSWKARMGDGHWQGHEIHGPTPLVAVMRCYVASRLGDEVDIPAELV